jgi:hypothetical protein
MKESIQTLFAIAQGSAFAAAGLPNDLDSYGPFSRPNKAGTIRPAARLSG